MTDLPIRHKHTVLIVVLFGLLCLSVSFTIAAKKTNPDKVVVFAAASLTNAITDISAAYQKHTGVQIKKSFASSSVLAKQIQRGAPAGIYISADQRWMNHLNKQGLIQTSSRQTLLANRLALIVPVKLANNPIWQSLQFNQTFKLSNAVQGRICTGQVDTVPIGVYAKQALTHLGWWSNTKSKLVGAQNVRTALAYVERGECQAGIVYQTDGMQSQKVKIVGLFPLQAHQPIHYPVALTKHANAAAIAFKQFLLSEQACQIFQQHGFQCLSPSSQLSQNHAPH